MTTHRFRSLVSPAVALTVTLTLAGCATAATRASLDNPTALDAPQLAVSFDNGARDYVHVYLVGERREWLLGRVEAGAKTTLRIPDAALVADARSIQLAVLVGERATAQAARDPRATFTVAQPAAAFVAQRWSFSKLSASGQLIAVPRRQ